MHLTVKLAVCICLIATCAGLPAQAQVNDNRPTQPRPQPEPGGGGGIPGGFFEGLGGVIAGEIARQIIEQSQQPEPRPIEPQTTPEPQPQIAPRQPAAQPTPEPIYRTVEWPRPRPVFRELPHPVPRPLFSQGRAAMVEDAPFEYGTVLLLVDVAGGADPAAIGADYGLKLRRAEPIALLDAVLATFELPEGEDIGGTLKTLLADARLSGAQPNYLYALAQPDAPDEAKPGKQGAVNDMRPLQYAPSKLNLARAHETGAGAGVTIGLVDTAVDPAHAELAAADLMQLDVLGGEIGVRDHGTAMGGLIMASAGLEGVAPAARLISVRAFDVSETGSVVSSSAALARALDRLVTEGAEVLNLSFAGPRDPLLLAVIDRLEEEDVPIIAAAGNNGPDAAPVYPGAHRHAIAVTATDERDLAFEDANLGMYVEIAAPGVDILSPLPEGRYDLQTGTSVATAHVTGIVALMLARDPEMDVTGLRRALAAASRDLGAPGRDEIFGAGLIDAGLAVASVGERSEGGDR